jgi:sulfite exporter TauE/SafE
MNFFWAALSLGFLGSFHCVGMCGPIALALPVKGNSSLNIFSGSFVYNSGRIITYSLIGLLFGLLGQGFALAGLQNILSITLGILILIVMFVPRLSIFKKNTGFIFRWLEKLKSGIRKLFGIHSTGSLLLIGVLNGLLPCGLVYLGIAGSIATGNALTGSLFMIGFGLGTFPAMITVTLARGYINLRFRERIRKVVPVFAGVMALMLILRGMNLGIPYVSPSVVTSGGIVHHQCCHK